MHFRNSDLVYLIMEDTSGSSQEEEEEIIDEVAFSEAVIKNDLTKMKSLIKFGRLVNSRRNSSMTQETLLQFVISHDRVEMFDYILGFKELQIDQIDRLGRTALFYAMKSGNEYFGSQLIDKGANIHFRGYTEDTILHIINRDNLKLGQLAIEKGVDINAQTSKGETPLHKACQASNFDWIYMLLYYGALASIPSHHGVLPVALLSIHEVDDGDVLESLLNHTFRGHRNIINLTSLVEAMKRDSLVFPKLLEITSEIDYDLSDLEKLYWSLAYLKTNHFKLFVDKFGHIIQEMIENDLPFIVLIAHGLGVPRLKELFLILLESNYAAEFVQNINPSNSIIARLVENWTDIPHMSVEEEEVSKIVCLMLSLGLSVTSDDLEEVYASYDYCELFKILLHMEIKMSRGRPKAFSMARLYYDPRKTIEIFFGARAPDLWVYLDLLSYYNHPRLKELCLRDSVDEVAAKAKRLPPVTSLLELSRNMTRKFIMKRYKIKNSMQFYTVVRSLPIAEIYKKIITLDKKLYY